MIFSRFNRLCDMVFMLFLLKILQKKYITSFCLLLHQWFKVKSVLTLLEPDDLNTVNTKVDVVAGWKNKQGSTLPVFCPEEAIHTRAQKIQNIVARVTEWRILIHWCFIPVHRDIYIHTRKTLSTVKANQQCCENNMTCWQAQIGNSSSSNPT